MKALHVVAALISGGIAAGVLLFAPDASAAKAPCPPEMALVGTSCVDKWEASLVEVSTDGTVAAHSPYESPEGKNVKAVSKPGVVPQAHMSLVEAKRACENAGKRLCKKDEWVAACKGPANTKYPYGDARQPGVCVDTGRTSPVGKYSSKEEMFTMKAMNDPRMNQTPNTVAKTGEAEACTNAYGVHDMVGNLHEWVDDGAFHGGYYLDTVINREGCDYTTTRHAPAYYDYSTGFRCCADAYSLTEEEPAPAPTVAASIETDESFIAFVARLAERAPAPMSAGKFSVVGGGWVLPAHRRTYALVAGR